MIQENKKSKVWTREKFLINEYDMIYFVLKGYLHIKIQPEFLKFNRNTIILLHIHDQHVKKAELYIFINFVLLVKNN